MLKGLTDQQYQDLVMSVGLRRKDRRLTPAAVAQLIAGAAKNHTLQEIASELALKDVSILRDFLSLRDLPEEVQSLICFGRSKRGISFSVATEIARLQTQEARTRLCQAALENALTRDEAQAVVQRSLRGEVDVDTAIEEILRTRPIVERQFLVLGELPSGESAREDPLAIQRKIRQELAKRVGGKNLLAVSVTGTRIAILLTEEGAQVPGIKERLSADQIGLLIADLIA